MIHWRVSKREVIQTLLFFAIIVFSILIITGTLTSGLHMVDDHEFLRFTTEMEEDGISIWELIKKENKRDAGYRFRPLYYPVRVIQTALFGTDLFSMSLVKGAEVVLTCILLYYVARMLSCQVKYSLLTVGVIMLGPQSAVWWKLGTPELTATWVFALAVLFLLKWREEKKKYYHIGVLACGIFTSLYKENYVLLIPFLMLSYLYISMEGKEITWKNIWAAVKENLLMEILLGTYGLYNLFMIAFGVGLNAPGYVGIDTSMSLWEYVKVFLNNFRLHLRIGQYGLWILGLFILMNKDFLKLFLKLRWQILLALSLIIPQMIIYAKTGLEERYIIPWIYGVAYIFVIVLSDEKVWERKKRKAYDILLLGLVFVNLCLVIYEGRYFTYRGKGIEQMFEAVVSQAAENKDIKILSAFAPYDESDKTTSYFLHKEGIKEVYVYREGSCEDWYRDGKGETISPEEADLIMTYNYNDRHFVKEPDIDFSEFEIHEFNTMRIAVRKQKE